MVGWDRSEDGIAQWSADEPPGDYVVMDFLADELAAPELLSALESMMRENEELRAKLAELNVSAYVRCRLCGADLGMLSRVNNGSLCGQCWHDSYRCNDRHCLMKWESGEGERLIKTRAAVHGWNPQPENFTEGDSR